MAVAFDAASSNTGSTSVTSVSVSHTFSGSNRAAHVSVTWFSDIDIQSLTVNGSSTGVTQLAASAHTNDTRDRIATYKVVAPPTGSITVQANWGSAIHYPSIEVVSLTGVDQTTPTGTVATAEGTGTTATVDVSSASGEFVIDGVRAATSSITVGAGQTSRAENENWEGNEISAGTSTEAGAASVTMSWTVGASARWMIHGVSFKPVSAQSYTLVADQGSYGLTGQAMSMLAGGILSAEAGSYSLIGAEAFRDITSVAEAGSYSLSGQVTGLVKTDLLTAASASYTLLGQAINLIYSSAVISQFSKHRRRFFGYGLSR